MHGQTADGQAVVMTFLIADVRGYSRYTDEYGDEAAARLANTFVTLVEEGVEAHGGTLIEVRGDEGLAVFTSARQAIRAAVDLQARFAEETDAESDLPLKVGIGIDSGRGRPARGRQLPRRGAERGGPPLRHGPTAATS